MTAATAATAESLSGVRPIPLSALRGLPIRFLDLLTDGAAFVFGAYLLGLIDVSGLVYGLIGFVAVRPTALQRVRLDTPVSEQFLGLSGRVAIATLAVALLPVLAEDRTTLLQAAPLTFALLLAGRATVRRLRHAVHRAGVGLERALIVGGGPTGIAVAQVLQRRREFGLEPIGFVEVDTVDTDLPTLGTPGELPEIMAARDARRIIVAFSGSREQELVQVLRDCDQLQLDYDLHVLPRFFELGVGGEGGIDDLWGFPLVPVRRSGPGGTARRLKRTFDVATAAFMLVAVAPVMALIALTVRLSGPGPVLFRQKRVGQHGQIFEMLKFRTMAPNDDSDTQWSVDDDDRVTTVGRFLRPTHLDELPQLVNVLRGDMALVGPRPERPRFVDEFRIQHRGYEDRHRVPVGLTGWAQVNGLWGDTSIEERSRFDNRYIEDWSLWREIVILLKTVPSVLGRRADDEEPETAEAGAGAADGGRGA